MDNPKIILAFDSDEAGELAALNAIDRHFDEIFADEDDGSRYYNGNWVREAEGYNEYLNLLVAVGVGKYHPRRDRQQITRWSTNRLVYTLTAFQKIIAQCLFYGNAYNVEWVLPVARQYESDIIEALKGRVTPKLRARQGSANQREWLKADDVIQRINIESVFRYYLPAIERKGKELVAKCPFHKGDSVRGTFNANPETGLWVCRSCHEGGNTFHLIMKIEKCDFNAAVNKANEIGS